mmetsp:Transcript_21877/g.55840  ORF Transcript_21877/g.55840 Transcript_21877/m.55840 type:complete len:247 (+) Transcript_21877:182-922(+)
MSRHRYGSEHATACHETTLQERAGTPPHSRPHHARAALPFSPLTTFGLALLLSRRSSRASGGGLCSCGGLLCLPHPRLLRLGQDLDVGRRLRVHLGRPRRRALRPAGKALALLFLALPVRGPLALRQPALGIGRREGARIGGVESLRVKRLLLASSLHLPLAALGILLGRAFLARRERRRRRTAAEFGHLGHRGLLELVGVDHGGLVVVARRAHDLQPRILLVGQRGVEVRCRDHEARECLQVARV